MVQDNLREAFDEAQVNIYLTGTDGRLRRSCEVMSSADEGDSVTQRDVPGEQDHVLASLAIERDEAMLIDTSRSAESLGAAPHDGDIPQGSAIAVPIPGRAGPRGAIECFVAGCEESDRKSVV